MANVGRSTGLSVARQKRVVGAVDDQSLEDQLGGPPRGGRLRDGLTPGRLFGLRLDDVERRHRADLDARTVVLDELVGQRERPLGHVSRLDGVNQVEIRIAHVRQRRHDRCRAA